MRCLLFVSILIFNSSLIHAAPLVQVDLSMDTGRNDTATPNWQEWQVTDGAAPTRNFGDLTIEFRAAEGSTVKGTWLKKGLATGATMATDGVLVEGGAEPAVLEMTISGLSAGKHTLVTYHNWLAANAIGEYTVSVEGQDTIASVTPSQMVANNRDAASGYLEFQADEGQPVVVRIAAGGGNLNHVILNGFEIDAVDPTRKSLGPVPADGDWHVDAAAGNVELSWQSAKSAVKHEVYLASDHDAEMAEQLVAAADHGSPAYQGEVRGTTKSVQVDRDNSLLHYCWRVDSVDAAGIVTRGDVWTFRVRHLAFPGAEGYGRFALGGRGGKVLHVTNLDDSGPGSLREALETEGPRTIVFDVSGRIHLQNRMGIRNPFVTIAGQTAPGKGICISNFNLGMLGSHDVIVRFIRVRPGDTAGLTLDGMGMASCDHSIIDHCSISWTQDEAFSSRGARNITLQRTLISEALNIAGHKKYAEGKPHGYAASIGGDVGSFHHNLLAHCAGRNWSLAGGLDKAGVHCGRLDIRNNVVYNWDHRTTDGGAMEVNFVANYYKPGPASRVFHVLMPERNHVFGPQNYYVLGNIMEGKYGADERYAGVRAPRNEPMENFLVEEPFFEPHVRTQPAAVAYEDVLADVGCNVPMLDEHDRRVIEETRTGTTTYRGSKSGLPGLPDTQEDVGSWENYPEVHRPADWDTDGDGLPGEWETEHGLNPNDPADGLLDSDGDGYTNLEDYLNWLAEGNKLE